MLIACPECAHEVSDRAKSCPKCGFPIAEHVAEQLAAQRAEVERTSRERTGTETDCTPCKGRGFVMLKWQDDRGEERQGFTWCERCDETGRVPVVRSTEGYWAVDLAHIDAFIAGEIGPDSPHVESLGREPPPPPSYPPPKGKADAAGSAHADREANGPADDSGPTGS
ncbi:MAG: zinc ribbon domain-containing protein [Myxococcales bacterium]|nr:zinc ribbon domain-containing protein [Myxococcales bacterium]MCB9718582.1 zinc ribbon domain-containing protein [Myxococcales bacterium]